MEWKELAKDAKKWYMKNEKDNIGKFLFRLWPEVPYAQLQAR
jgi:hypothetical protein